ncbi:importin-13-like protein cdm isoform X2 [Nomia melanderi]|uniref:importin-13-like protein cdm isoform X2 n=1 Tax=Nomia melanderi TaxID=2448451 RepID=UPI0013043185|nr:importin-13 isoform X2 [Nomia melanderi]XP_031829667.1 importin-13 isoform X2 [Nomia melanderi]XP_031829673.1 importin-13 isoform X2 [Nomia melanderi]
MDYTAVVDQAVKQFYADGNNEVHTWLLRVQASPEAWTFVWELLDPSKSWEVQFFAATTLYAKISKHWDEVPQNEYPALRDRLLNNIKQPNIPKFILSKLCQALAAFLANVSAMESEEESKNVVDELMGMLPFDSLPMLELLLRTLSLLPVEFERRYEARRIKLRENLVNGWCKTTWLLQQVFTMCNPNSPGSDSGLHLLAMECALFWLKVSQLPLDASEQIYHHLLIAAAYYAPSRDNAEADDSKGWEVVHECLNMIVNHCELRNRPQTLWNWAQSLVTMARQYNGKYFCEILTAMGEAHSRYFLHALVEEGNETQKSTSEGLIELLLQCSEQEGRYPTDETRSCIPFGFWYSLQDDINTLDEPYESRAYLVLKPVYARLAQALLRKSTLPSSPNEAGDVNERELFRCYRQDVADTLEYCYRVLGQDLLVLLGQRLSRTLDGSEKWTEVESTLHAFEALADSVEIQESHYIPAIMDLVVTHIPYDLYPREVLACVCSTVGRYAEWIGMHPDPWLEKVLRVVTLGLTSGLVTAPLASMALKDLVRECNQHLTPFAPSILNIIEQTLPTVTPGCAEGLRLMYAAGKLLNILSTVEEKIAHLDATLGLCIIKIRELLEQPLFVARDAVTNQLKMATMFFSTLEGSIGKPVLDGLLPIFNQIIGHPEWSQDNSTLEEMYICAQKSLLSLLHPAVDARPLLPILATSYKNWPHPAALNLLRQLVLLLGQDPENAINHVFAELSSVTLSGVRACRSVRGNLSDWAELMESYLGLLAQICKKNSRMLLQVQDQVPEMLQCGIDCLTLPEIGTVKASACFLSHIIDVPEFNTFVQQIGPELIFLIMQCVAGRVPRNNLDPYAEVLVALKRQYLKWVGHWLRDALDKLSDEFLVSQVQKDMFIRQVLKDIKRQRACDILKEFSLQNLVMKKNTGCVDQNTRS